jgi:GNAT superfamily N-acetyltransferase
MTSRYTRLARLLLSSSGEKASPEIKVYSVGDEIVARAVLEGEVVGLAAFNRDGKFVVANDLWVRRSFRRQGIASLMYEAVEKKGFTIEPSDQLTPEGQEFWKKRGLPESEARKRHIVPGAHPNDSLFGV